ncbi:MAG: NADH-quinone oxidoreductase subunit N [Candidatus Brachytrichaceae bacterium NZ_4S206]|jgi:NADH-quinone oxidoreductase subunit N
MAGSFVEFNPAEFLGILPEILLLLWSMVVLALDLVSGRSLKRRTLGVTAAIGMIVILVVAIVSRPAEPQTILGGMIRNDLYTFVFRIIFIAAGALTCLVSIDFRSMRVGSEYYAIIIFTTIAMSLMAGANDLIMLFLATESSSLSLYLLAGFYRGNKLSAEAGMKYFVFGAVTSAVMLFGLSLFYGLSGGNTSYQAIARALLDPELRVPVSFAALLVLVGFAFKTSAFPFHFWAPDVYQGAPTPISGYISTASKAAGFAILMRFLFYTLPPGTSEASLTWAALMQPLAILTMVVGGLLALVQNNVKRMLAYSSVAQAGYILVGVTALAANQFNRADALAAVIFYIATYMLTNICAFAVVGLVSERVGGDDIEHFNGLGRRAPYLALGMTAALVSLLGAPPLVGFVAKLLVFAPAVGVNLIALVVIAVIMVLVSVVYYLNVVRAMYVERTERDAQPFYVPAPTGIVVLLTAVAIVLLTVVSPPFWNLAVEAAQSFFPG